MPLTLTVTRLALLASLLAACGNPSTPFPTAGVTVQAFPHVEIILPSETPIPSDTPAPTSVPTDTVVPTETFAPTLTASPIIQLAPPTATGAFVQPTGPRATRTTPPTNTPPAPVAAIRFRKVSFVAARPDSARPPDGSLTTLSVEFTGSRPPFTVRHDNLIGGVNANGDGQFDDSGIIYTFIHFTILKTCGATVVGTITVSGGDGQTFTSDYFVPSAPCS